MQNWRSRASVSRAVGDEAGLHGLLGGGIRRGDVAVRQAGTGENHTAGDGRILILRRPRPERPGDMGHPVGCHPVENLGFYGDNILLRGVIIVTWANQEINQES
jgi:hypothetical protein